TVDREGGEAHRSIATPIDFTDEFGAGVRTFGRAVITIWGSAGGAKTVTVSGGPSTYNVAVSGMSTAGTVIASIPAGVAQDAANRSEERRVGKESSGRCTPHHSKTQTAPTRLPASDSS